QDVHDGHDRRVRDGPAVLHPFPDLPHDVRAITGPHDLHDRHFEVTELAQCPPPPVIHVNTGTATSTRSGWGARGGKRHRGDDFIARSPCLASGGAGVARRRKIRSARPALDRTLSTARGGGIPQHGPRWRNPSALPCGGGTLSARPAPAVHGSARRSLFSANAG